MDADGYAVAEEETTADEVASYLLETGAEETEGQFP